MRRVVRSCDVPPTAVHSTDIYASHSQFYVADGAYAGGHPDFWAGAAEGPMLWDGAALERHLDVQPGVIAVGTIAYGVVHVDVELWDGAPADADAAWDHVVQASLETPSGRVVLGSVEGWERGSGEVEIQPGSYRVRVAWAGLEASAQAREGDRYRVQLWPGAPEPPRVLRWWPPWDPASVEPRPSGGGRLLVGAEAEDARRDMHWLASRGEEHLFVDDADVFWEHSNLRDAAGTPQLEELPDDEADRRYGPRSGWAQTSLDVSTRGVLRALWQSASRRR